MNADKLIQLADNKYRLLNGSEELDAPSAEEEKIIALYAYVKDLIKNRKRHKDLKPSINEKDRHPIKKNRLMNMQKFKPTKAKPDVPETTRRGIAQTS